MLFLRHRVLIFYDEGKLLMNMRALIDVASQTSDTRLLAPLSWVGMRGISLPIQIEGNSVLAHVDFGVDLIDQQARGIHMSRLYLALTSHQHQAISITRLKEILQQGLASHHDLSSQASITLKTQLPLLRPSLLSELSGYKSYPLTIKATLNQADFLLKLSIDIYYSSTCPCSAALSRQLIQQKFLADFADGDIDKSRLFDWLGSSNGIIATPHSQRSIAQLQLTLAENCATLPIISIINKVEAELGTAVQTAVKRVDEQAFALANGQNLMFCEDAARRIYHALIQQPDLQAFTATVIHQESLHAHDAVAVTQWQR